jgi:hypothetical protein
VLIYIKKKKKKNIITDYSGVLFISLGHPPVGGGKHSCNFAKMQKRVIPIGYISIFL